MNRFVAKSLIIGAVCAPIWAAPASVSAAAQGATEKNDRAVLQNDHAFLAAMGKSDKAALGKLLDANFTWTDSAGNTFTRAQALQNLPTPAPGYDADPKAHMYGDVGAVQSTSGKVHVLRVWVKRSAGWHALVYQEVTQAEKAATPGPSTNDCQNPCKTVPYKTKNDAEKGVILSWQQLETAVTNHDPKEWRRHFADEFVLIATNNIQPTTKAGRIEQLSRPGIGPAPPGFASGHMVDFGDTVVMISQTLPYSGKPAHITRVWFKADPTWKMALSYQTTIQSAEAVVPK